MHQTKPKSSVSDTRDSVTSQDHVNNEEADKKEEKEQEVVNNTEQTS